MNSMRHSNAAAPEMAARAEDLLSDGYQVAPENFWMLAVLRGDDGYDRIESASRYGWKAIPSWGLDGWDLGSWPLVVMFHRSIDDAFELAYNVEGDITVYRYATRELRDAATDYLAFWHWKHEQEAWVDGIDSADVAPARLRGPFSWKRLNASKGAGS